MNLEGTVYEILAKVNNLTQDGEVWISDRGNKFILTRYGFMPSVNLNYKMECKKLQEELEDVSIDLLRYKKEREQLFDTINRSNLKQKFQAMKKIVQDDAMDTEEKLKQLRKRLLTKDIL